MHLCTPRLGAGGLVAGIEQLEERLGVLEVEVVQEASADAKPVIR